MLQEVQLVQESRDAADLIVKPLETDEELRLANDLMAKVHGDYFTNLHWLEACGAGYPGFRREHTRIVLWKGELAGSLRLNTETIRLGEARLKMGGFCWVSTAPRHRHKGVCRALMLGTLQYMKAHNYHVSLLFGIPNFYHQFGFVTTLADCAVVVEVAEVPPSFASAYRMREGKPGDIPAVRKIHAADDSEVACSLLRTSAHITNKWERRKGLRVLTSEHGKVVAYFIARGKGDHLSVSEVGAADHADFRELLGACAKVAAEEAAGRIRFLVPPPHPFARFLLQYKSVHEMHVVRDCGGMMAFVNIAEALENLIPEWESLLAKSAAREFRTEVTLFVDRAPYRIRANRGAVDIAQLSGGNKVSLSAADLMHLVTGYRYLEDVLNARRRLISPEARALLATLFPKRCPYVWDFDRF